MAIHVHRYVAYVSSKGAGNGAARHLIFRYQVSYDTEFISRFPLVNVNVDVRTWGPHLRRNVMYDVGGILVSFA